MSQRIIDLTLPITDNMPVQGAFQSNIYVRLATHESTLKMGSGTPEDPHTSAWNYIGMIEHIGTHVDAFYHMNPKGLTIDEMPLDMFLGKAVCFDMTHIPDLGEIQVEDMEEAERKTGVTVDGHIVLLNTGLHKRHFPNPIIFDVNPGLSVEATHWLADRGSKLHGVEGPSTDIMSTNLFPSHRVCRDRGITHYEWLVNLEELVDKGEFMFYGVPLNLHEGTGSPVRAFAIVEE
jgi:kynurenine formamidase